MNFKIEKKGYSAAEVDAYIANLKNEYEEALSKQKERIFELKQSLQNAESAVKAYKEKSGLVTKAIYNAVAKAEEIERLSQIKYDQEIKQLKAFHDKWIGYYNRIMDNYPLDEELLAASKFNSKMKAILDSAERADGGIEEKPPVDKLEENYAKETERLKDKRIGYINVRTNGADDGDEENLLREMLPDGDMDSPIVSGNFDPIERINRYFASEKSRKKDRAEKTEDSDAPTDDIYYADRSESGFSFEEALNPKEDLSEIMKELGLFSDD